MNESKILTIFPVENSPSYLIALDEVGRGAGAGPVVVCASVWKISLKQTWQKPKWLSLVDDSKEFTQEKREECFSFICRDCHFSNEHFTCFFSEHHQNRHTCSTESHLIKPNNFSSLSQKALQKVKSPKNEVFDFISFALGIASNHEIDQTNIWHAIQIAANRALFSIHKQLEGWEYNPFGCILLVDGNLPLKVKNDFIHLPQVAVIRGDALLKTIGFSSILAKVARDRYMSTLQNQYPHFGFEQHKGYLTSKHRMNLKKFGHTPVHRQSFLS